MRGAKWPLAREAGSDSLDSWCTELILEDGCVINNHRDHVVQLCLASGHSRVNLLAHFVHNTALTLYEVLHDLIARALAGH